MINLPLLLDQFELLSSVAQTDETGVDTDTSFQAMLALLSTDRVEQHAQDQVILLGQTDKKMDTSLPLVGNKLPALTVQNLQMTDVDDLPLLNNMSTVDSGLAPAAVAATDQAAELIEVPIQVAPITAERSNEKRVDLSAKLSTSDTPGPMLAPQQRPATVTPHITDNPLSQDSVLDFQGLPQIPQSRYDTATTKHFSSSAVSVRDHAQFSEQLANRLVLLVNEQKYTAQLRLNPPELGLLEVRINLYNDQANVSFISQHASVREIIEEAFPRLREMLQESGLNLGDTSVSHQLPKRHNPNREYLFSGSNGDQDDDTVHLNTTQPDENRKNRGSLRMLLIDHYV